MAFQDVCEEVVRQTDGVLGCFLVDLRTGFALAAALLEGVQLDEAEFQEILRSSGELFQGELVKQFAKTLGTEPEATARFVQEVQVTKVDSYQFMAAMPGWEDVIVVLVAEKTLSLGFGWMIVRQAQDQLLETDRMPSPESSEYDTANAPSLVVRNEGVWTPQPQKPPRQAAPAPRPRQSAEPAPAPKVAPPTKAAEAESGKEPPAEERKPEQPVALGPRARMFRTQSGKK